MEDSQIIQLYWDRDPDAISATAEKYCSYCTTIARNILGNSQDVEECVNDTYLNAWNSMPPHRPHVLASFLGRLTRNLSLNRYKLQHSAKRGGYGFALVLDELADCVSGMDVEQQIDRDELLQAVNVFLAGLSTKKRGLFVCRYWYADSISDIAKRYAMSESNVSTMLSRIRKSLRSFLRERGFAL